MKLYFNVDKNLTALLKQEDTDHDNKITVEDKGPKLFNAISTDDAKVEIKGTYFLSNFLQELILAKEAGNENEVIDFNHIFEKPIDRLSRMIKDYFWDNLTRRIDAAGIKKLLVDTKSGSDKYYLYVPYDDDTAYNYFRNLANDIQEVCIEVVQLPKNITPEFIYSINNKPGIVSLALQKNIKGEPEGVPFVVPGGRFNEMYGWDSYFESLGLIIDGRVDLAKAMAENFVYEINHYGQILNANRTYYLTRSQPPFLTSFTMMVYNNLIRNSESKTWLEILLNSCIKEYNEVWLNKNRLTNNKLSRYFGTGIGLAPETEETHFDAVLKPYAEKAGISVREYHSKYLNREIIDPEIEEFIKHDRSIRESGHDTSYRLDKVCAHLNTVDLNSLLYKYEIDIAEIIKNEFDDHFISYENKIETSENWFAKAAQRKSIINNLMLNK
jgi:alpha,alpha-trehalase